MSSFLDFFGLKRRKNPRIAARWLIDARVPDTERYVGFFTCDISTLGTRLVGESSESFKHVLSYQGLANLRLRVPGRRELLPLVVAELKWGMGPQGNFQTGWRFTQMDEQVETLLSAYIAENPGDIIRDPRE